MQIGQAYMVALFKGGYRLQYTFKTSLKEYNNFYNRMFMFVHRRDLGLGLCHISKMHC